ncbi:phenylacetate-CoA ligase [Sediminihabitans luteus]|uniref:Phenylacetate-CoA ligase n=1 Tax=Sediminihabitans luteus TaxID=1138585 RepID=A0A2M9CPX4_9CELL|nr:AMP-binding protein [Sediminihabitans luteus]PJJ73967.1 phenylacetate-CoA ligase [Sediminihabitans luteus]GII98120.1 hypothetical protein Slu03_04980 [Sediminihabitans luteus]
MSDAVDDVPTGPSSGPSPDAVPSPDPVLDPALGLDPALAEYVPGASIALDDAERWPLLDAAGAGALDDVRRHRAAPRWRHATGDRLVADDLPTLDAYDARLRDEEASPAHALPDWVTALVARAHAVVPRYRRTPAARRGDVVALQDLVPVTRDDLRTDLASFVPVDVPLDRVLEGTSSGSTGAAITLPLHPVFLVQDLRLVQHLVERAGVSWAPVDGRLGLVNLLDQRHAYTYASAMTGLRRALGQPAPSMARVNLDPSGWDSPDDRATYLSELDPQVLSSTPLALLALADLDLDLHPVAVVSGAAHLTPAARARVERTWGVPVVDLYGLTETGSVAARTDDGPFVVVPGHVWVEVLDDAGRPVPDGTLGEVVVTTDENPYLPLLRYRTGDRARRVVRVVDGSTRVELHDLEGRAAVRYAREDGTWVAAVDATQILQSYGAAAWQLHQGADGAIALDVVMDAGGSADRAGLDAAIARTLGRPVRSRAVPPSVLGEGRARRFSTDLAGGEGF